MHEQRVKDGDARMGTTGSPDAMDLRLMRALERAPEFDIPAGFAARVVGHLKQRSPAAITPTRYGQIAMWISMAALVLALVALYMRSADGTVIGVALEWMLCVQLVGVAMWLGGVRIFSLLEMLRADTSVES